MKDINMTSVSPRLTSGNREGRKYKTNRSNKLIALAVASVGFIGSLIGFQFGKHSVKQTVPTFPEEQVVLLIDEVVKSGENLDYITYKYYSPENAEFFESPENYKNVIQSQNEIKHPDYIAAGETLYIPVFVDVNNEYYIQMKAVENELNELIANEKWIDYTVKYGDTFDGLASLASGSFDEIASLSREIQERNKDHFPSGQAYLLQIGDTIKIINPRIGELKRQLAELKEIFRQSIMVNNTEKGFKN